MGTDKAFLPYNGRPFVAIIAEEMLKVSGDVLVVIGNKDESSFRKVLDERIRVVPDSQYLTNPMGGMLSTFQRVSNEYVSFVACDVPLMKSEVIRFLYESARGHSAAVPRWESGEIEPLCAVYNVRQSEEAGLKARDRGTLSCGHLVAELRDVNFVPVDSLRRFEPGLAFLKNVNHKEDFLAL
jgi:molybdopterin-guanine dinucleotide biosynthesis protein A